MRVQEDLIEMFICGAEADMVMHSRFHASTQQCCATSTLSGPAAKFLFCVRRQTYYSKKNPGMNE